MFLTRPGLKEIESKTHFRQWSEVTGWHGILDFHLSDRLLLKLMWLAVILFGLFLAINQCVSLIMDFTSDDQWVTSVTYEMPENDTLDWPNIRVMNLNHN